MSGAQHSSYFAPPLAHWQRPVSFRTAKYDPRKRRRKQKGPDEETEDDGSNSENSGSDTGEAANDDDDNDNVTDYPSSRASTAAPSSVILTPNEAHQYRIAGLSTDQELPGGQFPHRAPDSERASRMTRNDIETELSQVSPPVFTRETGGRNTLRMQHLAVITTILHRCLMEGDYVRAGRAWGLILRDEFGGHKLDVRSEGRWGVGAEILLWTDMKTRASTNERDAASRTDPEDSRAWFTRSGFERAKGYYDRLILEFPFRKTAPNALGPVDFYLAMYGLWISVVQEESRLARESAGDDEAENYDTMTSPAQRKLQQGQVEAEARTKELAEAQQIASQMDELLVSPPYSDTYELLRLRGMISLWIGDLHVSSVSPEDEEDLAMGDDPPLLDPDDSMVNSFLARMEHGLGMERKAAEVERAEVFFEKAKARGWRASMPL